MTFLDQRLTEIAHKSLAICRSVSDALAEVFSQRDIRGGVSLSLQSKYGTLVAFPDSPTPTTLDICSHPLLEPLASGENEERIALLLGPKFWYMVSCFSLSGIAFYPVISIPAPPDNLRWVRYEMLGALDCFHLKCKECISSFFTEMIYRPTGNDDKQGTPEKNILEVLSTYSNTVESAALIDGDGFVLLAAGGEERAEEIAGTLALFNSQTVRSLDALGGIEISSLSVGSKDRTFLSGRIPQSTVSLAFSVCGPYAQVVARFLFDTGIAAMRSLRNAPEALGEYRSEADQKPVTTRDGWLSRPRLVPQGAYVSFNVNCIFHDPDCIQLLNIGSQHLRHWHQTRADAIKAGLTPCPVCNP